MTKIYTIISIVALLLSIAGTLYASLIPYVNEGPGAQGERQRQAVECAASVWGWEVKPGCCYGGENCDWMNPCNGRQFNCGNGVWNNPQ